MPRTAPAPNIPAIPGMNPGVLIKAGGGAGGGAGAGGGRGKGGKKGADGSGDEDNAADGNKGAGACGQGANGACTNCGQNVSRGDPVDVSTGKVFTIPKTDLFLRGVFNLRLNRSYSSFRSSVDLGLGFGWTHTFAWSLEERHQSLMVRTGDGREVKLPRLERVNQQAISNGWHLTRGETFYAIMPGKEFIHLFSPIAPGSSKYKLDFIVYRNHGHIALHYHEGRLVGATDTVGRRIVFRRGSHGRIEAISASDDLGRTLTFAQYQYDDHGHLLAVTDADGNRTSYAYDEHHLLTALTYPNGLTFTFTYDASGRCTETWGQYPDGQDPALAEDVPDTLLDGQTPAKGIYHCKFDYVEEGYTEVIDSVRLQRFESNEDGVLTKAVGAGGGVTTREFDEEGHVSVLVDPTGATWRYEHDVWGNITTQQDPDGHVVEIVRDAAGREQRIIDACGGVTTIGRDNHGHPQWVQDQTQSLQKFVRDERGLVTEYVDRRGATHHFEWDAHANCVGRTFPSGARYTFSYDYWGRMSSMTDPLGAVTRYRYSEGGNLLATIDPLGRTSRFEYDQMGNRAAEIQPDNTVVRFEYAGLNWLYRITNTDGSQVNIRHNREGWPVYVENERGERHSFRYHPEGAVAAETDFLGRETRYTHDALGRTLKIERDRGAREMTYSRAGLLLEEVEFDGSVRRFEYNARGEVIRAVNDDVDLVFERDAVGNIIKEVSTWNNREHFVESSLNAAGDRTRLRSSLGTELRVERDVNGRVRAIDDDATRVLEFGRDARGLATTVVLADGGAITSQFDSSRRLVRRAVATSDEAASGTVSLGFEYSEIDEVTKIEHHADGGMTLDYDVRRRVVRRGGGGAVEEFQHTSTSDVVETVAGSPRRTYGAGGQLQARGETVYNYDSLGNLIERIEHPETPRESHTVYSWNAWGFLESIEQQGQKVQFAYDAFARRVAKVTAADDGRVALRQRFVWDRLALLHQIEETDDESPLHYRTYLSEDNDDVSPIGHRDNGGSWYYYVQDVNQLPLDVIDGFGRSAGSARRSTHGRTTFNGGSSARTPFRLPGQFEDVETGLHYNRYRYYDPDTGGFISPDPLGLLGGLRPYGYAPNPIAWSDPMGWYHVMTILEAPPNFVPTTAHPYVRGNDDRYRSGYTGTPCQDDLCSNNGCHTEQKFCADLLAQHRAAGNQPFRDENFRLKGKLPPCPACHAAMMQAASETGANIKYEWDNPAGTTHSVTYDGSSNSGHTAQSPGVTVSGQGTGATLVAGYTHTPTNANPGPPQTGIPTAAYGYDYAGSYNTYYSL